MAEVLAALGLAMLLLAAMILVAPWLIVVVARYFDWVFRWR